MQFLNIKLLYNIKSALATLNAKECEVDCPYFSKSIALDD